MKKKGFTLAELLVVVAIIAVLVAIAIPVFSTQTKKAEEAVEIANARTVYAEGMSKVVAGEYEDEYAVTIADKTYTFSYDETDGWKIEIAAKAGTTGVTVYNAAITDFSAIEIDGE